MSEDRSMPYPILVDNIDNNNELSIARSIIHHGHASDFYIAPERLKKREKWRTG